ncbi:MAG: hypothetical protein WC529_06300 [Candidatus Margulisiibacteriota bacterium]
MDFLHPFSILLEAVAAVLGVLLATQKRKAWGWCLALTFAIYVYYDLARYLNWGVSPDILYLSFFIASVSVTWAVWQSYKSC